MQNLNKVNSFYLFTSVEQLNGELKPRLVRKVVRKHRSLAGIEPGTLEYTTVTLANTPRRSQVFRLCFL